MDIAILRDWVVVILGFLGIGAMLVFVTLLVLIYRKVMPILDTAQKTVTDVRHTSSVISDNVITPIAKAQGVVIGVRRVMEVVSFMSKKGGGKDGTC